MKNLASLPFLMILLSWSFQSAAQFKISDTGMNLGAQSTSRGMGLHMGLLHGQNHWWGMYEWNYSKYRTRLGELLIVDNKTNAPMGRNSNITSGSVRKFEHGRLNAHEFVLGYRTPITSRSWLGIGSGVSILQVYRAKQLNYIPRDPNSGYAARDLFTAFIFALLDSYEPYQLQMEKNTVVGVPLVFRLQSFSHPHLEKYFQVSGTFAKDKLSTFQLSAGVYVRFQSKT